MSSSRRGRLPMSMSMSVSSFENRISSRRRGRLPTSMSVSSLENRISSLRRGRLPTSMSIPSFENRVSSRPTRCERPFSLTSPSTLVVVVSSEVASLRYVDGKTLIGMGTLASKSSLPGLRAPYSRIPFEKGRREKDCRVWVFLEKWLGSEVQLAVGLTAWYV